MRQPTFYYDIGDPYSYLVAERILHALPSHPIWEPVLASDLPDYDRSKVSFVRDEITARAGELTLQQVRWPESWPFDSTEAMLAATYAKQVGRAVAYSLAAFRQAYAGGQDLSQRDFILIAAAACEMHPRAVIQSLERKAVRGALAEATSAAIASGVRTVPAVQLGDQVLNGAEAVEKAIFESS